MFNKLIVNSVLLPIVKFRFASVGLILCLAFLSLGVTIGTAQIKYGDSVHLQNQYPVEGGYLDTRGRVKDKSEFAEVGKYETSFVSTHPKSDRDKGSGSWMVESASGKSNGSPLLVGDRIYLKNMYPGGGYLDTWGYVKNMSAYKGSPEVLGVFTTPSNKRDGGVSGTWIVRSAANKSDGTPVNPGDNIHLENAYPNGGFLDVAGRVTQNPAFKEYEGSSLLVFTSASSNRFKNSGTWKITNVGSSSKAENKAETVEAKVFRKSLVGTWSDGRERLTFNQSSFIAQFINQNKPYNTSPYHVVDEKTVEFNDEKGNKQNAIMSIEDNNTTLIWHRPDLNKVFKFKRVQ